MAKFKKEKEAQEPVKLSWQQSLLTSLHDIIYVLAGFMIIYMLFFRVVVVVGPSMNNTLVNGDRLVLLSGVLYNEPEQGDIIVASKDSFRGGECIVKRVIATEGQTVKIDQSGVVYVDGVALDEDYTVGSSALKYLQSNRYLSFPLVVEEGHVFVMGDNRENSTDSRYKEIGLIDEREILGKAIFLMWPGEDSDFGRIGTVN